MTIKLGYSLQEEININIWVVLIITVLFCVTAFTIISFRWRIDRLEKQMEIVEDGIDFLEKRMCNVTH